MRQLSTQTQPFICYSVINRCSFTLHLPSFHYSTCLQRLEPVSLERRCAALLRDTGRYVLRAISVNQRRRNDPIDGSRQPVSRLKKELTGVRLMIVIYCGISFTNGSAANFTEVSTSRIKYSACLLTSVHVYFGPTCLYTMYTVPKISHPKFRHNSNILTDLQYSFTEINVEQSCEISVQITYWHSP